MNLIYSQLLIRRIPRIPFKNKKAAPPRSISERSEQPFLSVSAVYNNLTEVSSAHFG